MKRTLLAAMIAVLCVPVTAPAEGPTVITVDTLSDDVVSWLLPDGECSLRDAINNANGSEDVTGGDCPVGGENPFEADTIVFDVSGTIALNDALPAFFGDLIIEGGGQIHINAGSHSQIFWNAFAFVELRGLAMSGGLHQNGGAIYNEAWMEIVDSTISNSTAQTGGGIYSVGFLNVVNSSLSGNVADVGGAIYNGGVLSLEGTQVIGNRAVHGGALYSDDSAYAYGSVFARNESTLWGGAIDSADGAFFTSNSEFKENRAGLDGGAIHATSGVLDVDLSTVTGNVSGGAGGGIYADDARVNLTGTAVASNSAEAEGGGMRVGSGGLNVTDGIVSQNAAGGAGGGIHVLDSSVHIERSTIASNTTEIHGGGLSFIGGYADSFPETFVVNSTIANNTGEGLLVITPLPDGTPVDDVMPLSNVELRHNTISGNSGGGIVSPATRFRVQATILSKNGTANCDALIGDEGFNLEFAAGAPGSCGFTNDPVQGDPLLAPLEYNGGPTPTMLPAAGSPVRDRVPIGRASCAVPVPGPNPYATDQQGTPRPQGTGCDVGAVELA